MSQPRTWTDEQVIHLFELAYEAGVEQERERIAAGIVELDECWITAARRQREDIIAERIATYQPTDPAQVAAMLARTRQHDEQTIDIARRMAPITTYRQVHATVTPTVWERIFWDLCPTTQQEHADIAPPSWNGRMRLPEAA